METSNQHDIMTESNVISLLQKYLLVGKAIYNCPRSYKAPATKYLHMTIFQVIASSIIDIQFSEDKPSDILCLSIAHNSANLNYFFICSGREYNFLSLRIHQIRTIIFNI